MPPPDPNPTSAATVQATSPDEAPPLSVAAIALMKGVVYRDANELTWRHVLRLQHQLRDHVGVLGLSLVIDEAEGYAYLRSAPEDGESALPRLVPRHRLSLQVSLLLALLRKAMAEFDATSGEGLLVVSRDRIVDELRTFLAESTNEARVLDQIDRTIAKVVDLGFLRPLSGRPSEWEVRRILKAFVDAQWLGEFDARLREYAVALGRPGDSNGPVESTEEDAGD